MRPKSFPLPPVLGYHRRGDTERRHHPARRDDIDAATEERAIIGAHALHIFRDAGHDPGDEYVVWLNTEMSDFDGLILGLGATRDAAVAQAVATLEALTDRLQGPAPITEPAPLSVYDDVRSKTHNRATGEPYR